MSFHTFGLGKSLLRAIEEAGYEEPRPIQAKTIPAVLEGRDVLGLAQTGTGKTAAFALPILERLDGAGRGRPRCLILAPTRELAIQIHGEFQTLGKHMRIRSTTVFGGVGAGAQVRALRANPEIIVACPGRLLDLAGSRDVDLSGIETLVLDEADHMFDMGFLPDIRRILALLPKRRQNLLFSATMPKEIRGLAERILQDPHRVELAHSAPAETIDHALYPVDQGQKTALLQHLLREDGFTSAIVFLRTKHRARRLARDLERTGLRAIALQGNMSQNQRQRAMQGFRDGHYNVLVATDIAARGIDVAKVSHVINYDLPTTPDAYTHRIGRTGRAEELGKACTLVTDEDWGGVKDIERKINMKIERIHLDEFSTSRRDGESNGQRSRGSGGGSRQGGGARQGRGGSRPGGGGSRPGGGGGARRPKAAGPGRRPGAAKPGFGAGASEDSSRGGANRRSETSPVASSSQRRVVGAGTKPSRSDDGPGFGAGLNERSSGGARGGSRRGGGGGGRGGRRGAGASGRGRTSRRSSR